MKTIGMIYYYDNGQRSAEFRGAGKDWYVWSPSQGQRLYTYRTRREMQTALEFVRSAYPDDMPSRHQLDLALGGLLPG